MKLLAILFAVFYALSHEAKAVDVVCDPWTTGEKPTHIAVKVDAAAFVDVPAAIDSSGNPYCKFSVDFLKAGAHTIKMRAVIIDATWGRIESVDSAPFDFVKRGASSAPNGLTVKP